MRRYFKIITLFLAIITCFSCFLGCFSKTNSIEYARERLKEYGVEVPTDSLIVYIGEDKNTPFGPRRQALYVVFRFKEEPLAWLEEYNFQEIGDKNERDRTIRSFTNRVNEESHLWGGVPQEYLPDITCVKTCFYLSPGDAIYYVFTPQDLLLYVHVCSQ